jgi:hypothetical protein
MKILKINIALITLATIISCQKEEVEVISPITIEVQNEIPPKEAQGTFEYLKTLGYNDNEIKACNKEAGFLVNDMIFPYELYDNLKNNSLLNRNQWHGSNVTHANSNSVTYYIDSTFPQDYKNELRWSFYYWNKTSPNINCSETTVRANADIICAGAFLNGLSNAVASLPNGNGNVGRKITSNKSNPMNDGGSRLVVYMHEIGHVLGYNHSDQNGGIKIPNTGDATYHANNACGSLMRSGVSQCSWAFDGVVRWSQYDQTAINTYYTYRIE